MIVAAREARARFFYCIETGRKRLFSSVDLYMEGKGEASCSLKSL